MTRNVPADAEDRFLDAIGSAIEMWGFRRVLGHVWAWLYLTGEPADAAAIGKRLGLSKAAVSTSVAELERWGCVHRLRRPGERRERFIAEEDVWKMVTGVFRQRERRKVEEIAATLGEVAHAIRKRPGGRSPAAARAQAQRVERMAELASVAGEMLGSLLEQGQADLRALRSDP